MTVIIDQAFLKPGMRVVVVQRIRHGRELWTTRVTGTVVRKEQSMTGSWFAHGRRHRLWLDRIILEKADGERVVLNLDPYSYIEVPDDDVQHSRTG